MENRERKTVREWLDTLPPNIKEEAIRETKEYLGELYEKYLGRQFYNLSTVIAVGFDWGKTKKGNEYWREVYCGEYPDEEEAKEILGEDANLPARWIAFSQHKPKIGQLIAIAVDYADSRGMCPDFLPEIFDGIIRYEEDGGDVYWYPLPKTKPFYRTHI
jgi:hypothetical protein